MVFPSIRLPGAILLAVFLLFSGACRGPSPLDDLTEIMKRGELRVVVRPGFGRWGAALGDEGIDERVFLEHFAQRLGLQIQWIESPRHDTLLSQLRMGRADIALRRFSPESLGAEDGVMATATIDWVRDVLVATEDGPIVTVEDLDLARLQIPSSLISGLGSWLPEGIRLETLPEDLPMERILERVSSGRYQMTATDSALLTLMRRNGELLRNVPVKAHHRKLVWAIRKSSHQLQRALADFIFAEKMLSGPEHQPVCRSLEEIYKARVLRVVMKNSPVTVSVEKGGMSGFEYELVSAFAAEMGLRVQPVVPPRGRDALEYLESGFGDLCCNHDPAPIQGGGGVLKSIAYRRVDLLGVVAERRNPLNSVEDLAGLSVAASEAIGQYCRELPLEPPMDVKKQRGRDSLASLSEVLRGSVDAAVVDEDTLRLELARRKGLVSGAVVLPGMSLNWYTNAKAADLMARINRFLYRARRDGRIRQLEQRHFSSHRKRLSWRMPEIPEGALSPFDQTLRWAGQKEGIDWRLLASLMYEESRFDPDALGPGGSSGLFQMMPPTWEELGVEDPFNPGEAIEGGARYLKSLVDLYHDLELQDRMAMAIASYNVGPRHVFDARALSRDLGLDPDRWLGNVETALLLLDDPEVARRFPAGVCRCRRSVGYTRRILRRYSAYRAEFPPS